MKKHPTLPQLNKDVIPSSK